MLEKIVHCFVLRKYSQRRVNKHKDFEICIVYKYDIRFYIRKLTNTFQVFLFYYLSISYHTLNWNIYKFSWYKKWLKNCFKQQLSFFVEMASKRWSDNLRNFLITATQKDEEPSKRVIIRLNHYSFVIHKKYRVWIIIF